MDLISGPSKAGLAQSDVMDCERASEYAVDLGGHDEVVLMQPLDLLGLERDRRIAPTEADVWMMAFSFREFTNLLNKGKCLPEIAKPEAPLDAVSFLQQLPAWGLSLKEFSFLAREWRTPLPAPYDACESAPRRRVSPMEEDSIQTVVDLSGS